MKLIRYILLPIVPIYYIVTWMRNKLYNLGLKSSSTYDLPIICVGNLSVGGTGKTPTIEYLINKLRVNYKVATLSRGYKRQSSGFIIADGNATATSIGDEPYQFYKKYKDIIVAVDSDRRHGISELIIQQQPDIILLDDAFQHRKVKAGFNILLTAYDKLYVDDFVLPTGNLREPKSGAKRAQMIIVTKCPDTITNSEKAAIRMRLNPLPNQEVLFSSIHYSEIVKNAENQLALSELKHESFTLVTGIANPYPLVSFLKSEGLRFDHLKFKDHHNFTSTEIDMLRKKKRVITTEKDYVRLESQFENKDRLFYLPIEFIIDPPELFDKLLGDYLDQ